MTDLNAVPERVYQRVLHWTDRAEPREDQEIGCLVSRYSTGSHGYAQVGWKEGGKNRVTLAHLALWRYEEGPIPDGMTVDHECKTKKCVERQHLRLLTNFDNARRTNGRDWPLGQCANGHPDSEQYMVGKRRRCRSCQRVFNRRYYERKKERQAQ
jgi:hypothetical protein